MVRFFQKRACNMNNKKRTQPLVYRQQGKYNPEMKRKKKSQKSSSKPNNTES